MNHCAAIVLILCASTFATGCGSYTLRGRVIEGFEPAVIVVPADDPRLTEETGVRQVRINVHRDPGKLAQELIASDSSGPDGDFAIELPAFGAGWMDERWLVETSRSDFRNTSELVRLPSNTNRQRLLIIVVPGRATPSDHRDDLWDEYRRYR